MQIFQVMALRTLSTSPTDDERRNLAELSERIEKVCILSLAPFFAKIFLSQRLLASRATATSAPDTQENNSSLIAELGILLELGGIEGVHIHRVNCLLYSQPHRANHLHTGNDSTCP